MQGQSFSYWEHKSFLSDYDVVIIGSGIVGLSAALHLKSKKPALHVGVLESGFLPSGASTKNAGFACFGSISEALEEIRTGGEDNFLQLVEMRWNGLAKLRKNLGDRSISFEHYGGYEIFKNDEKTIASECIDRIDHINKLLGSIIGKPDIYSVHNAKIADFGFAGVAHLIENKYEGQIDTGKMMRTLISKAAGNGVQILNNCRVKQIGSEGSSQIIKTTQGKFQARAIILATNAFTHSLVPELEVIPGRGQILVTAPVHKLSVRGSFHYNRGYTYFRNVGDRVLLGGFRDLDVEAEQTVSPGTTARVQNALEELLHETILPGKKPAIEYRWSGVMGFGPELKPIVKKIRPGLYCAVRCNGMGIAIGSLLGEQVADMLPL